MFTEHTLTTLVVPLRTVQNQVRLQIDRFQSVCVDSTVSGIHMLLFGKLMIGIDKSFEMIISGFEQIMVGALR